MWFEEPIPPENVEEMAKVKHSTHVPIASGERLTTVYDAARAIEADAVSILQPDIGTCGGFIQSVKMAAIAEAHYVEIAPHLWGGAVLSAAVAQFSASIPNFLITECVLKANHFFSEITESFITWQDSCILLPDAPGLGVTFDDKALKPYLIDA
jgi:2-dehydro-3-deoxyphosphogalactonate aldolase